MLAIYTGKGVPPDVKLRECISHMSQQSSNKATHFGFETQRRGDQKSKTGVSVAPKWTCVQQHLVIDSIDLPERLFSPRYCIFYPTPSQ